MDTNALRQPAQAPEAMGFLLALISALSYSTEAIAAKILYARGLAPLTVLVWRFLLAAASFWLLTRLSRTERSPQNLRPLLFLAGLLQAFTVLLLFYAFVYIPAGLAILLFYLYPAFVTVGSAVFFSEHINRLRFLGLVLTSIGLAVISGSPGGRVLMPGLILALGAALMNAAYILVTSGSLHRVPVYTVSSWTTTTCAVVFFVLALLSKSLPLSLPDLVTGSTLLFLALVPTVLALAALLAAITRIGPTRTTIVATLEPLFTAILGHLILGEHLATRELVGGALIVLAVLLQRR